MLGKASARASKSLAHRHRRRREPLTRIVMCAVPSLPAHPRLQPRDSANRQVGPKTMPGPSLKEAFSRRLQSESAAGPQHSARSAASPKCRCTSRLLGWVPLAQGGRFTRGRLTANPPSAVAYAPPPQQSSRPDRAPQTSSTIVRRAHAVCGAKRRTPVVNRRRVALKQTRTTGCPLMLRACGMPPEHSVWAHIPHHAGQSLHARKQD